MSRPFPSDPHRPPAGQRGFSLLEVIVATVVFLTGVVALASFFPHALQHNQRAVDRSIAAYLAQQKAEEIRRDETAAGLLTNEIELLNNPGSVVTFVQNPRFAYRFSSKSLMDPDDSPGDVRDDEGVARVIVQYAPTYRPDEEVLYELRFDR